MKSALMRMAAVLLAGSASMGQVAAQGAAPTAEEPMQVQLVRSAEFGCEPSCVEWIAAQGRIDGASLGQFKRLLAQLGARKLPVLIDSGGGSVDDSIAIGRLLRAKDLDVVVTPTVLVPCAATDTACRNAKHPGSVRGLPQGQMGKCASACAFVLAGGTRRFVGEKALVGVHQIRSTRTLYRITTRRVLETPFVVKTIVSKRPVEGSTMAISTPQSVYDKIKRHFGEMGVRETIMPMLELTPSTGIRWLSRSELRLTRLATDWIDGERLLMAERPAVQTTSAPLHSQAPLPGSAGGMCREIGGLTAMCAVSLPLPITSPDLSAPMAAPVIVAPRLPEPDPPAQPAAVPVPTPVRATSPAVVPAPVATKSGVKPEPTKTPGSNKSASANDGSADQLCWSDTSTWLVPCSRTRLGRKAF